MDWQRWSTIRISYLAGKRYSKSSGKKIIYVKSKTDVVPIAPVIGQQWKVKGLEDKRVISHDWGVADERHYIDPMQLECMLPDSRDGFVSFVSSHDDFIGIGDGKAKALWDKLGESLYQYAEQHNREPFTQILTDKSIDALFSGLKKYENLKLASWFSSLGVPLPIQKNIIKYHSKDSVKLTKSNPYLLSSFGLNFEKCDEIALTKFSLQTGDDRRLTAAIEVALRKHEKSGNTVASIGELKRRLANLLNSSELVEKALLIESRKTFLSLINGYQLTSTYVKEQVIARRIKSLMESGNSQITAGIDEKNAIEICEDIIGSMDFPLNDEQNLAVRTALNESISLITGGAGTGKTTVLKVIVKSYLACGFKVHCVALSGRAAKRIYESTGYFSSTIASLLFGAPIETENSVLIIDEASMIDVNTMFSIINHLHPSVRIILVGRESATAYWLWTGVLRFN